MFFTKIISYIKSFFTYTTDNALYTFINNDKYDLSNFKHPGGNLINLSHNIDSKLLIDINHPFESLPKIYKLLETRKINNSNSKLEITKDLFYNELNYNVSNYLKNNNLSYHSFQSISLLESSITLILYLFSIYKMNQTGYISYAILNAFLTTRLGFIQHMGNHGAYSKSFLINNLLGYFMDLAGSSNLIWKHEHMVSHHVYTNLTGKDNDFDIGSPFIRLHPKIKYQNSHKYQIYFIFLGMVFGLYKWIITDFISFFNKSIGNVRLQHIFKSDIAINLCFKIFFILSFIVYPTLFYGFKYAMLLLFIRQSLTALFIENIFIVNHIQPGLDNYNHDNHWSINQINTSCNWSSKSLFANWISIGLNNQIEHHLFPTMNPYLYPYISPIVKTTCNKYNIKYNEFSSFYDAWISMVKYIRYLSYPILDKKVNN